MDIYTDGAARGNPGPAGIGFVFMEDGKVVKEGSHYIGVRTNNEAEYLAMVKALEEALGEKNIRVFSDSQLLVNQVKGTYKIKNENLKKLCLKIKDLLTSFDSYFIRLIPREDNIKADKLANKGIDDFDNGETKELTFSGIQEQEQLF